MRKLLLFLLLTVSGYSQTASLIAHTTSAETQNPTTSTALAGATAANSILVVTSSGMSVGDSDGHSFVPVMDENGYDTHLTVWAAFGITISSSDVITTGSNYNHVSSLIMAFSNLASFDKSVILGVNNTNDNPLVATLTPTNPNEVIIGITQGAFGTTPAFNISGSTAGFTALDKGPYPGETGIVSADGYKINGSGTPSAVTYSTSDNSYNGHMSAILAFTTAASPLPLTVTPTSLPNIMRTKAYPQTCIVPAGGVAPYVVTLADGTLPAGLTFDGHCITGNPTTTGTTTGLVFHVVDHAGATVNTNALSISVTPFVTVMDLHHPYDGFVLMPGAKRSLGVYETDPGATGRVNYTIPEGAGFANLSCTTNCGGSVRVTVTAAAGNCTISGTPGSYIVTGGTDFHIVATSRDANEDGSFSSSSAPFHICKGDHLVETQPSYNQAFQGQTKIVYAYVLGQTDQAGTWTCTAPDNSSCDASLDVGLPSGSGAGSQRHNRSVTFSAPSVAGRYKLIYTSPSAYDSTTASNYSWIYVGSTAAPVSCGGTPALPVTQEKTEATACFADPAFGARSYTVKADGTGDFAHIYQLPVAAGNVSTPAGYLGRIFNIDTTGSNPTKYPEWITERTGGTRDNEVYICGVIDNTSCHNPVMPHNGSIANPIGDPVDGPGYPGAAIKVARWQGADWNSLDPGTGPDYVNVTGIDFTDEDAAALGNNRDYGLKWEDGRHGHVEGVYVDHMTQGAFFLDNTSTLLGRHTEFSSIIGSRFDDCGKVDGGGGTGFHCVYMQSSYPLLVGNYFGTLIPEGGGSWVKNRGGGSIFAANAYQGVAGYTNNWWGDDSDSASVENVEMFLGQPGVADCGASRYCTGTPGKADWRHVMANEESLSHDYFYANVLRNHGNAPYFSYAGQNTDGCVSVGFPWCTNGDDHTGGFFLWNNTFDRGGAIGQSSDVFYNNVRGGPEDLPGVYGWTYLTYQNNSLWNDGSDAPFYLDLSPVFQGQLTTNLFATGSISIAHPIVPGNTGWSTQVGGNGAPSPLWPAYSPKDAYVSGVDSANMLFSTPMPYDPNTFKPVSGSPLVGAGTAISEPEMALLPVRFEPDPINGFMAPRTESVTTIGARSSGIAIPLSVTTTSFASGVVGTPYSASGSATGGTTPYTWTVTGTLPPGVTLNSSTGVLSGTPTTAGTYASIILHVTDAAAGTANSGSLSITIAAAPVSPTVTTTILPSGVKDTPYTITLTATGGSTPYTWARTSGTLPAGLTLNTSTGVISGIPTTAGTTTGLVFTATDSAAQSGASSSLTLVIASPPPTTGGTSINGNATITGGVVIQ